METTTQKSTGRRRAAQRRRTHNVFLAGIFLLIILIFLLINLLTKEKTFSEAENRSLAVMPEFSVAAMMDGSYFSGLTDYFSDQFFARDSWISMKGTVDSLLGRSESAGVFLCEDDYLISAPEVPDPVALPKTITAINSFSATHGDLNTAMMLVPGAAAMLPDKLPKNAPVRDQLADLDDVALQLDPSIIWIDAAKILAPHIDENIYYRTDHHWTSLGARYAFDGAAGALGITSPVSDYDVHIVSTEFQGTLSSKSGNHSTQDTIEVYTPDTEGLMYYVVYPDKTKISSLYRSECLDVKDQYTVFFGGNHSQLEILTTANNDRTLLVFKDSYANCFMQFLTPYYEKIIMVDPRYYYDSVDSLIISGGVTDVLFLYSADTFLTDHSLVDVLSAAQ